MNTDVAVGAPYGDNRWAWGGISSVRPIGGWRVKGGVLGFGWVLNGDDYALICATRTASLSAGWDGEEALELASVFTIGRDSVEPVIGIQSVTVGGNPHQTVVVECQVIWAGDRRDFLLVEAAEVGGCFLRIAADQKEVPGRGLAGVVIFTFHDEAVLIFVDRCPFLRAFLALFLVFARSAAVGVIGQSDINLGAGGVNLNVFWAVPLGGTDFIGSLTGEDSNFLSVENIDVRIVLSFHQGHCWLP